MLLSYTSSHFTWIVLLCLTDEQAFEVFEKLEQKHKARASPCVCILKF
jgi:hypothetical protein